MSFDKKFWIAFVVVLLVSFPLGYLVHSVWIGPDYALLTNIMRTDEEAMGFLHIMVIAHAFYAFGLVWIYCMGHDGNKDWLGQGIRYGIAITIVAWIPIYLIYHAVAYFPFAIAVKQIIGELLSTILLGIVLAYLYRGVGASSEATAD